MKPVFGWPGGKSWATKHILPTIPQHECYCEPFAGGLAVLLAKEPSAVEVVNDINSDLVNFYRCVRFHLDELIRELQWALNSREEFNDQKRQAGLTDIQRAARWYRVQSLSFGGDGDSYAVNRKSGGGSNRSRRLILDRVATLSERLDRVNIEHLDWEHCVRLYDSPETFFFLDPPYLGGKIKNYKAWSLDDLKNLAEALRGLKGDWLLTINDGDDTRSALTGFKVKQLSRRRGITNQKGQAPQYRELLVSPN